MQTVTRERDTSPLFAMWAVAVVCQGSGCDEARSVWFALTNLVSLDRPLGLIEEKILHRQDPAPKSDENMTKWYPAAVSTNMLTIQTRIPP